MLAFMFAVSLGACLAEETQGSDPEGSVIPETPGESDETTWLTPETSDLGIDSETIEAITSLLNSGNDSTSHMTDTPITTAEISTEGTGDITTEISTPVSTTEITTTPVVTTEPVVTTTPPEVTTKPVETTEPPVVTTKPVETTTPVEFTTPPGPQGTEPPLNPPVIPDITMPVVEPEKDIVVTVKSSGEYDRHVPTWDGKTLTFWDGRTYTAPEDGKLIIKDESGNILDYYVARSNSNVQGDSPEDFYITRVRYDGDTILLYMNNSDDFENNRPTWDGKTVKFSDNYYFELEEGERILIVNQKGQTFGYYRKEQYTMEEVPYFRGMYAHDQGRHIIISDPKLLYDENGNLNIKYERQGAWLILYLLDYPGAECSASASAEYMCICDAQGNIYYSTNGTNEKTHFVPYYIQDQYGTKEPTNE